MTLEYVIEDIKGTRFYVRTDAEVDEGCAFAVGYALRAPALRHEMKRRAASDGVHVTRRPTL